jgi:hypothetical protein
MAASIFQLDLKDSPDKGERQIWIDSVDLHKPRKEGDRVEVANSGQIRQRENTPKAKEKAKNRKSLRVRNIRHALQRR